MGQTARPPASDLADAWPSIRTVSVSAPWRWLEAGLADMRQIGGPSFFYGASFAVAGWLLHLVFEQAYALLAALTTGFLLLGPFLAMGLYDLSRRRQRGEGPRLGPTLAAWRPNLGNVAVFAALLAVVLLIWARASLIIFALFFDAGELPTFAGVVHAVLTLEQPAFALAYFVVGGFFALFVFAFSVVAMPLMLDRNTGAITAAIASLVACARNPAPMLLWAACIAALVALGFATMFVGLILTMPLIGHATWHAYRDMVEGEPAA